MPSKTIDSYQFFISEGTQQKAYISCWKEGAFQGYIDFYEPEDLKSPGVNSNGSLHLCYPIARLEAVITTLREESPINIQVWGSGSNTFCRVGTANEPVGEEEGH